MKQYELAIADYTRSLELAPNDANTYGNRAMAYANTGKNEQAILDYTRSLELEPNNAVTYTGRGLSYVVLEDYATALKDFNRALEINPDIKNLGDIEKAKADAAVAKRLMQDS